MNLLGLLYLFNWVVYIILMCCVKIEPLILGAFKSELLKAIFFDIFVVNGLRNFCQEIIIL